MTIAPRCVGCAALFGLAALAGCGHKEHTQANAPPQGYAPAHPGITDYYVYHNDQGLMADMSIADIHFIPHSTDLSGAGEARLQRYAELLATTGGTIHYDTGTSDHEFIDKRLETATMYLASCTPSKNKIEVVLGLAGGPGMSVKEASADAAIAQQPEKRVRAYQLQQQQSGGFSSSSGGN